MERTTDCGRAAASGTPDIGGSGRRSAEQRRRRCAALPGVGVAVVSYPLCTLSKGRTSQRWSRQMGVSNHQGVSVPISRSARLLQLFRMSRSSQGCRRLHNDQPSSQLPAATLLSCRTAMLMCKVCMISPRLASERGIAMAVNSPSPARALQRTAAVAGGATVLPILQCPHSRVQPEVGMGMMICS